MQLFCISDLLYSKDNVQCQCQYCDSLYECHNTCTAIEEMKSRPVIYEVQTNSNLSATQKRDDFNTAEIKNIVLLTQLPPDLGREIICRSHYSHNKEIQCV